MSSDNLPMTEIELRFFASVREAVGKSQETYLSSAKTIAELRNELVARGGGYAQALGQQRAVRAAINQTMVPNDAAFAPGQRVEVAFFPPVTGG